MVALKTVLLGVGAFSGFATVVIVLGLIPVYTKSSINTDTTVTTTVTTTTVITTSTTTTAAAVTTTSATTASTYTTTVTTVSPTLPQVQQHRLILQQE
ncbi:hypothetical protein I4U23_009954 [Adineta vaga]|nr:hypothetical protein I4U23_009954 [Adineta vaga]